MRIMRQTVVQHNGPEETSSFTYWRETVCLSSLRKTISDERTFECTYDNALQLMLIGLNVDILSFKNSVGSR